MKSLLVSAVKHIRVIPVFLIYNCLKKCYISYFRFLLLVSTGTAGDLSIIFYPNPKFGNNLGEFVRIHICESHSMMIMM